MLQEFTKNFNLLIKEKNQRSFEKIYLTTSTQLFNVVLKICRNEQCAQECLQEGYIKLWNNIHKYNPEIGKPLPWVTSIFRNQAIDVSRKNKKIAFDDDYQFNNIPFEEDEDDQKIEKFQSVIDLNECIAQLHENQKNALFMAYYSNMTYENISKTLGFPPNTVKTWVRRTKAFIRRCLKNKQKMLESLKS